MREYRCWIADDGEKFDNEQECINYEDTLHYEQLNDACVCFDSNLRLMNPLKDLDGVLVLGLKTQEALDWWVEYNNRIGYDTDGLDAPGVYIYDNELYEWVSVQQKIDYLKNILKKVEEA